MFFELVRRNVLSAFLTRLGGVVFVVVFLHLPDGHWFITHRAQLYVTNTVALVKVKGPHIDGTLAAGREREREGEERSFSICMDACQSSIISVISSTHQLLQIFVSCSISLI